jgi:hypothetical protein
VYGSEFAEPFGPPLPVAWFWVGALPAPPPTPASASWHNGIELTGVDGLPPAFAAGSPIDLRLHWQNRAPLADAYTAFVHLLGPDGAIVAQDDHAPRHGFWPTTGWRSGIVVDDTYTMTLPSAPARGDYRLVTGWYATATGERVLLADGSDAFELARWTAP